MGGKNCCKSRLGSCVCLFLPYSFCLHEIGLDKSLDTTKCYYSTGFIAFLPSVVVVASFQQHSMLFFMRVLSRCVVVRHFIREKFRLHFVLLQPVFLYYYDGLFSTQMVATVTKMSCDSEQA